MRDIVCGFVLGNSFDCLLLCFDDAADKQRWLMTRLLKRVYQAVGRLNRYLVIMHHYHVRTRL